MATFQDVQRMQMEEDPKEFIQLELLGEITAERKRLAVSQSELSRRSGVPQKTISRMEAGKVIPKFTTIFRLLDALELDIKIIVTSREIV